MIVIFPLLVSKNVNTNLVQGLAVTLEQYIAAYAISDFVGKSKEFNKYYQYKMKGGKIYQETDANWFDLDPVTQSILENQESLTEAEGFKAASSYSGKKGGSKKGVPGIDLTPGVDPTKTATSGPSKSGLDKATAALTGVKDAAEQIKDWRRNKDTGGKQIEKPKFSDATVRTRSINLEPTWVEVNSRDGMKKLGIKVIPMMVEGFNIKHTLSADMEKYFLQTFIAGIGRKLMRLVYRMIDKWTAFGSRPRGDVRQDVFYARTGHDGQPFVLLDKNEDIPKLFFAQPQNILKLWKLSWGNLLIADDSNKTVMFCMKKYKGMCSNFTYSMIYAQTKEMARVFEDMEDARKATSSLFKTKKKITALAGRR